MNIMLFGISCVGKTTVGKIMAEKLGYQFYDMDEETKKFYNCTLEEFVNGPYNRYQRDVLRLKLMDHLIKEPGDKVFAITPLAHEEIVQALLAYENTIGIELVDKYMNIYNRMVFSDEEDNIYRDDEYKEAHRDYYIKDIKEDQEFYGVVYLCVPNQMHVDNLPPEEVADSIIESFL